MPRSIRESPESQPLSGLVLDKGFHANGRKATLLIRSCCVTDGLQQWWNIFAGDTILTPLATRPQKRPEENAGAPSLRKRSNDLGSNAWAKAKSRQFGDRLDSNPCNYSRLITYR